MPQKLKLHINQRVQDAYGNKGRVLNPELRDNIVRVKMDAHTVRDYDKATIKPISITSND